MATSLVSIALGPLLTTSRIPDPIAAARPTPPVEPTARAEVGSDLPPASANPANPIPAPPLATRPDVSTIGVRPPELAGLTATPATRRALQKRLDQLRERYGVPGISVTMLFPDGSSWVGVSGLANVAAKAPVTASTSFAIASVSKTFTAALVLALAHDGTIDLDESVRTYLPDVKVNAKITVRQLLDHTSGLRDYFFHPAIDKKLLTDRGRVWDTADAMKHVGKAYFKPGTGWHYSNTNYLVLGMLAERVGGAPLADQIRARFLEPLGLRHTWYQPTEEASADGAHGYRFESTAKDAPAIDLSDGSAFMPFTSVVTAAGRSWRLRLQFDRPGPLGPRALRRRRCCPRSRSMRWSATSAVPRRTSLACPTAWASSARTSTGSRHSAIPVGCSASARSSAGCRRRTSRSRS